MSNQVSVLPKEVERVSEKSKQNLTSAKIKLVRAYPFLGFLVMTTEYRFTDEIPTCAATTIPVNRIFVNPNFHDTVLKTDEERSFVLLHELLHIFLEHIGRQTEMTYDPKLWNVAADFCINSTIVELKSNKIVKPSLALHDEKWKGMSADAIYHALLKEADGDPKEAMKKYGGDNVGDGQGTGKQVPLDEIGREAMSDDTKTENRQKMASAVSGTSENDIRNMGQGAADMFRMFKDMVESKIPWQKVLRDFITDTSHSRYTYNRVSRRSTKNVLFPSQTGDHVNLVFGVDTSGSMSETDLGDAMSELKGITDEFGSWVLTFLSCDTGAHEIGHYDSEDGDNFESIDKGMIGGGGTDMNPMVEYANDMDEPPAVIIILTDGYIPEIDTVDEIPTLVVVTRRGNKDLTCEDAEVLFMED